MFRLVNFTATALTIGCAWLAGPADAASLSLQDAASLALQNDPRLQASEQAVASSAANVDLARSAYRPNASVSAGTGLSRIYIGGNFGPQIQFPGLLNPTSASLKASQPLYTGGLAGAQLSASKNQLESTEQDEASTRQQLLLTVAAAYLDLKRDRAVVELNRTTVDALEHSLGDTQKRFDAGEATRTDVAQATARRAEADASLKRAIASVRGSEAALVRVIGTAPDELISDWPTPNVPPSLDQALALAGLTPAVLAADAQSKAAHAQINVARAEYWPKISLDGQATSQTDAKENQDRYDYWSVQLKATLPIYEGGATQARVAAARATAAEAEAQTDNAHRAAIESISQSWATLQAADEVIAAYQADVDASASALDAIQKELQVGTRTTLNLLDAQRDILSAQVNLAGSRHDRAVAAFQLLVACGELHLSDVR